MNALPEAVEGASAFGHRLVRTAPGGPGGLVVSAPNIATAFAMLRGGAAGGTGEELDQVFGFPREGLAGAYAELARNVEGADAAPESEPPEVMTANALWVAEGFPLHPAYVDGLVRDFDTSVRTADFTRHGAAEAINAWVEARTRGRIDRLFDDLDPETRLVLASAIYLKARWAKPFDPGNTQARRFRPAGGESLAVPTMLSHATYDHVLGATCSAVRLPYAESVLSMWLLLARDPDEPPAGLLDPAVLGEARSSAKAGAVDLSLPKWHARTALDLTAILPGMGVTAAFTDRADFSGMSPRPLTISRVLHRADLVVDEDGTEAAAVTGTAMRTTGLVQPGTRLAFDRPFAYAITHDPTGLPLFQGVVNRPAP